MDKDRKAVCAIISEMLDTPDEHGLYPTTEAYDKLEALIEETRYTTLGWAYAHICLVLDAGRDPRAEPIPQLLASAVRDLGGGDEGLTAIEKETRAKLLAMVAGVKEVH